MNSKLLLAGLALFSVSQAYADINSFSASAHDNLQTIIEWNTSDDADVLYYEVQRADDAVNFTTVATVWAVPEAVENQEYHFSDMVDNPGVYFYRIHQFDAQNESAYSQVEIVTFPPEQVVSAYPNPAENLLNVVSKTGETAQIAIIDRLGRIVAEESVGTHVKSMDISDLHKGNYLLQTTDAQGKINHRNIVIR